MELNSKFLGKHTIDPDTIITFPDGIPGFVNNTRYKLFHQEGKDTIYWLQSLEDEELTFSVARPLSLNINYQFTLTSEEEALLNIDSVDDILILIMLRKDEGQSTDDQPIIKGSIKSPLIINVKSRKGLQKILIDPDKSITIQASPEESL